MEEDNSFFLQQDSPAEIPLLLRPGERVDDLQRGDSLRIIQDPSLFCFGMDAVLLSAYVGIRGARRGLDLGTGNGIIPLLLSDRTDCRHLTGLEIQPASADLAVRSVALNGLQDRISIVQGDIREADRIFAAASFDFITCNPPYRILGSGRLNGGRGRREERKKSVDRLSGSRETDCSFRAGELSAEGISAEGISAEGISAEELSERQIPDTPSENGKKEITEGMDAKAIARHELLCSFDDVVRAAKKLLRPGGRLYLVHRPLRLPELFTKLCTAGLEPKRMRLVHPHIGDAPNMVLLDCVRGGSPELRIEPPLVVYGEDGSYTQELRRLYQM